VQTRTQVTNRVSKLLEDTTIKVASVVSDVFGTRARRMVEAFIDGERDPQTLSVLALGS
jgi:transposase